MDVQSVVIGAGDGFKRGVVHASLFPSAAIVDSSLTLGARGEWSNGLEFDFSASRGRSELE